MKKYALAIVLLFTFFALIGIEKSHKKQADILTINTQKIAEFKVKHGFIGECEPYTDNSIFFRMNGTFPLPEPVDSSTFEANSKIISSCINELYQAKGTSFDLRTEGVRTQSLPDDPDKNIINYTITYSQYFHGAQFSILRKYADRQAERYHMMLLSDQTDYSMNGNLQIVYSLQTHKYYISNNLYVDPLKLQKPNISKEQAMEIIQDRMPKPIITKPLVASNDQFAPPPMKKKHIPMEHPRFDDFFIYVVPPDKADKTTDYNYVYIIYGETAEGRGHQYYIDGMTGKIIDPKKFFGN